MQIHLDNPIIKEDMEDIYAREFGWQRLYQKTVLVTGAYGMLASYLVAFLMYLNRYKNMQIRVIAQGRNKQKAKETFGDFWTCKDFIFSDIELKCEIKLPFEVDYIIHAAGPSNPRMYSIEPVEVIEPNVIGTYHLLEFACKQKCEGFLFFSTGDIYGRVEKNNEIYEDTLGMLDPLNPHSCYSESKRLAETMCVSYWREHHIPTKIARIAHTYGPTMDLKHDPRVFADFMRAAIKGESIVLHSNGKAKRPFAYLADAVAAYMLLLLDGISGEAYNIANSNQFLSMKELAAIISEIPHDKVEVKIKEREVADSYLNNDLNLDNKLLDSKLLSLGFEWHYDTMNGFQRTYRYIQSIRREEIV